MGLRDFCHAKANTGDGRAMLRYVSRRRETERERDGGARGDPRGLRPIAGEEERFCEALRWREGKGREVSYMSVVISPERRDTPLTDEDWRKVARIWTANRNGNEDRHVAYVHRDTDHEHMHLAVARSYYSSAELARAKEQTRLVVRDRERHRDQERAIERAHEPEREPDREPEREPERGWDRGRDS